ncbi:MAG: hypothetical protein WBY94_31055 [Polyangiaceae bacterium]
MRVLDAFARIVQLGGDPARMDRVAAMRATFEERTGPFSPDDDWFEARSRAFWCHAVTRGRFGREVEDELTADERSWLGPLERAHRGLFRAEDGLLIDVWSGAELIVNLVEDSSRAELDAAAGQLFDGTVVGSFDRDPGVQPSVAESGLVMALVPGAVFHSRDATASIELVLAAARARELSTDDVLDALLRMERMLRSHSRVKAAYAYRPETLTPQSAGVPVRRAARPST